MVSIGNLFCVLALSASALASSNTRVQCVTELGNLSKYVLRQTSTKTELVTQTKVIIKTAHPTITPRPTTITIHLTHFTTITTTEPQKTHTVTATIIDTSTETDTITITQTTTETDTTTSKVTSTSTVPTPDGFIPAVSQLAASTPSVKIRAAAVLENKSKKLDFVQCDNEGKPVFNTKKHPQAVDCVRTVTKRATKRTTSTVKGSVVTVARCTKVHTATVTKTITKTKYLPNAKTTVTQHSSTTITITMQTESTITATTTVTAIETLIPKVYAACQSDNLLTQNERGKYINALFSDNNAMGSLSATTPYECCVGCQNTELCTGSAFFPPNLCLYVHEGQCRPGQTGSGAWAATMNTEDVTISNGPCGVLRELPPVS